MDYCWPSNSLLSRQILRIHLQEMSDEISRRDQIQMEMKKEGVVRVLDDVCSLVRARKIFGIARKLGLSLKAGFH